MFFSLNSPSFLWFSSFPYSVHSGSHYLFWHSAVTKHFNGSTHLNLSDYIYIHMCVCVCVCVCVCAFSTVQPVTCTQPHFDIFAGLLCHHMLNSSSSSSSIPLPFPALFRVVLEDIFFPVTMSLFAWATFSLLQVAVSRKRKIFCTLNMDRRAPSKRRKLYTNKHGVISDKI